MRKQLLHTTLRKYLVFSLLVLMVTAPVFYVFTEHWHRAEAEEALLLRLHEFERYTLPGFQISDIEQWNEWNRDQQILPDTGSITKPWFSNASHLNIMDGDQEPYRELYAPLQINGTRKLFYARENLLDNMDMVYNIVSLYVSILILLIVGMMILSGRVTRKLWKPYYAMLSALEGFKVDKPEMPDLPESDIDEFHRLKEVSEKLIERNVTIYRDQKEFVENAAHELQTPLAVLQGRLDNLIQDEKLTPEQLAELSKLSETIYRLHYLNKNLLLLSRLEYDQYQDTGSHNLAVLLEKQLDFLEELARGKNITIEKQEWESISVQANQVLLEVLLRNLLSNALKHNASGGIIRVQLQHQRLLVQNTGPLTELDKGRLFNRFFRANDQEQGSGLGLAIVKKITDRYGWIITYHFDGAYHSFTISF